MVNLVEALLEHNTNKLELSISNIERGMDFVEDISPNLVDLAIKLRTLLRLYRTEQKPTTPTSPWAWAVAKSVPGQAAVATDSIDLTELKSALNTKRQKKVEERKEKQEKMAQTLTGSIKALKDEEEDY